MKKFDVIVIGAGIGLSIVEGAVMNNKSCAIIEHSKFGGTCLTRGCIPSKVLVAPADAIRSFLHASKIGIDCFNVEANNNKSKDIFDNDRKTGTLLFSDDKENTNSKSEFENSNDDINNSSNINNHININGNGNNSISIDWEKISKRMWQQIDISKSLEIETATYPGVTVYKGVAEFTGEKTLKVKDNYGNYSEEITGETIVVCPGAKTFVPPIEGLEEAGYITSESFFNEKFPEKLMKSMAILGAGAIGAEFAHIFSSMGVKVTLIEKKQNILPLEEEEISEFVKRQFVAVGIDVHTGTNVKKVIRNGTIKSLTLENEVSGERVEVSCDEIFVATGIIPNTNELNLVKTQILLDKKGWIVTDEFIQTSQKGIYALGDINGKYQFRHKANYEADICVHNIFHANDIPKKADYSSVPWAIYTWPQVAHVGLTEKQALAIEGTIFVGIKHYSSIAKGFALGYEEGDSDDGFVKLIVDRNQKILGAHIVGPHAAILIQSYVYLMNVGGSCIIEKGDSLSGQPGETQKFCVPKGNINPIKLSMVIHPALSELTAWVLGEMKRVEL